MEKSFQRERGSGEGEIEREGGREGEVRWRCLNTTAGPCFLEHETCFIITGLHYSHHHHETEPPASEH